MKELLENKKVLFTALFLMVIFSVPAGLVHAQSPGGISSNLQLWLRSDSSVYEDVGGLDDAEDGDVVEVWKDQTINNFDYVLNPVSDDPTFESTVMNFNPGIRFYGGTNAGHLLRQVHEPELAANDQTVFYVQQEITSTADVTPFSSIDSPGYGYSFYYPSAGQFTLRYGDGAGFTNFSSVFFNPTAIFGGRIDGPGASSAFTFWRDGRAFTGTGTYEPVPPPSSFVVGTHIGRSPFTADTLDGYIPEIIIYDQVITDAEAQQIQTYLALKYGTTLDDTNASVLVQEGDYVLSNGATVVWDGDVTGIHNSYHHDVAGIGQDTGSGLNQKISGSSNIDNVLTMALDNDFITSNESGLRSTSLGNGSFLMWGNDNASGTTWTSTGAPVGYELLARTWRVQETGTVGTVFLQFNVNDADMNIPAPIGGVDYYFIVDTDADGILSDETPVGMTDMGGGLWNTSHNFDDGALFTIASQITPQATVEFSAASSSDIEASGSQFPVLLVLGTLSSPETIDFEDLATGTASTPADYTATGQSIVIQAGIYDGTLNTAIAIPAPPVIVDDSVTEANETIRLRIRNATGNLNVGDADGDSAVTNQNTYTILNDDGTATIEFDTGTGGGPESTGTGFPRLRVTGTVGSGGESVTLTDNGSGTANTGTDYTFTSYTITIPAGTYTNSSILITNPIIIDDSLTETNETIILSLQSPTGDLAIGDANSNGTVNYVFTYSITDDDDGGNTGGGGGNGNGGVTRIRSLLYDLLHHVPEPETPPTQCPYFEQYMRRGDRDGFQGIFQIGKLQRFLLEQGFGVGQVILDGIFGKKTEQAVKDFQVHYTNEVLWPWNVIAPTGWFYQTTRRKANEIMGCEDKVLLDNGVLLD